MFTWVSVVWPNPYAYTQNTFFFLRFRVLNTYFEGWFLAALEGGPGLHCADWLNAFQSILRTLSCVSITNMIECKHHQIIQAHPKPTTYCMLFISFTPNAPRPLLLTVFLCLCQDPKRSILKAEVFWMFHESHHLYESLGCTLLQALHVLVAYQMPRGPKGSRCPRGQFKERFDFAELIKKLGRANETIKMVKRAQRGKGSQKVATC